MSQEFTDQTLAALKEEYAPDATEAQFTLWIEKCRRDDLVPVEDVVLQLRSSQEYDPVTKTKVFRKRPVYITTIRALTKIASRTGKYRGTLPYEWIYLDGENMPNLKSDVPLPDTNAPHLPREPWAARVSIKHADFDAPVTAVVRFNAYAQLTKRGDSFVLNNTWATRGPEQLAKCGFAAALRAVFPEAAGLYLKEELEREDAEPVTPVTPTPPESVAVPVLASVPQTVVPIEEKPFVNSPNDEPRTGGGLGGDAVAVQEVDEPEKPVDELPTPEEKKAFGARLRKVIEGHDREAVRLYMERAAGNTIGKFTVGQYTDALTALETAKAEGKVADLIATPAETPKE
jgi:hypothetical protein